MQVGRLPGRRRDEAALPGRVGGRACGRRSRYIRWSCRTARVRTISRTRPVSRIGPHTRARTIARIRSGTRSSPIAAITWLTRIARRAGSINRTRRPVYVRPPPNTSTVKHRSTTPIPTPSSPAPRIAIGQCYTDCDSRPESIKPATAPGPPYTTAGLYWGIYTTCGFAGWITIIGWPP